MHFQAESRRAGRFGNKKLLQRLNVIPCHAESKIPDGKLPDGSTFKGELRKQTLFYRAIDNTAPKVGKEGSTIISRWIKANPTKTKSTRIWSSGSRHWGRCRPSHRPLIDHDFLSLGTIFSITRF